MSDDDTDDDDTDDEYKGGSNAYAWVKSPGNSYTVGFSSMMNASVIVNLNFGPLYTLKMGEVFLQSFYGVKLYAGSPVALDFSLYMGPKLDLTVATIRSKAVHVGASGYRLIKGGLFYAVGGSVAVTLGLVNEIGCTGQKISNLVSGANGQQTQQ